MEKDVVIVIPAYQPNEKIMSEFMAEVKENFQHIVIVNDGSGDEYADFFSRLKADGYDVLTHSVNLGKGRALKTAINHVLNTYSEAIGMVTADCDGQHLVKDIQNVVAKLKENTDSLVIGSRNFNEEHVPLRSSFGNKMTRGIFAAFVGIKITDTQSGLRAFGTDIMKTFLRVAGERYEYETNMLIECKEKDIKIEEVVISTVYIDNNATSHFNPIKDSINIYKLFIKFIIAAFSSFIIDIGLFSVLVCTLPEMHCGIVTKIVVATVIARVISSLYNFFVNSKMVFKKANHSSIVKYYVLVIVQMLVSAFAVSAIYDILGGSATFIKLLVDTVIFIVNFYLQREWVFKS